MSLHSELCERGLEVLAFLCNQFGYQEPKVSSEVETCVRARFGVSFKMMEKVNVNGAGTHDVYKWLRLRASDDDEVAPYLGWNFIVFAVGRDGRTVMRLPHSQSPASARSEIETMLAELPADAAQAE